MSVRFLSENFSSVMPSNIRKPTKIRAGAVAKEGMEVNRGENRVAHRKRTPVVMAVRPVRPPTATPAEDSTKVVVVEVPSTAPAEVATASAIRAGLIRGR